MDGEHLRAQNQIRESKMSKAREGFKVEKFGKGRNAIQSNYANEVVGALNMLGSIQIIRGEADKVVYGDNGVIIQLKRSSEDGAAGTSSNPFRIYSTTSWLKYKVTTGKAITTGNPIAVSAVETEFTITSGVTYYWFYLEMTATTAEVKVSATTPTWSTNLIPIGWVNTVDTGIGVINQVLRDHVFNPCAT